MNNITISFNFFDFLKETNNYSLQNFKIRLNWATILKCQNNKKFVFLEFCVINALIK